MTKKKKPIHAKEHMEMGKDYKERKVTKLIYRTHL